MLLSVFDSIKEQQEAKRDKDDPFAQLPEDSKFGLQRMLESARDDPFAYMDEDVLMSTHSPTQEPPPSPFWQLTQRKTKGQQLKGKIVSEFFTLFRTCWHFFIIFPPGLSTSKQRALAQGEQKRRKDNKRKRANRFCTLVVARLSSSY